MGSNPVGATRSLLILYGFVVLLVFVSASILNGRLTEIGRRVFQVTIFPNASAALGIAVEVDRDVAIVRDADVTVAQPLRDNLDRHAGFGKQRGGVCRGDRRSECAALGSVS